MKLNISRITLLMVLVGTTSQLALAETPAQQGVKHWFQNLGNRIRQEINEAEQDARKTDCALADLCASSPSIQSVTLTRGSGANSALSQSTIACTKAPVCTLPQTNEAPVGVREVGEATEDLTAVNR